MRGPDFIVSPSGEIKDNRPEFPPYQSASNKSFGSPNSSPSYSYGGDWESFWLFLGLYIAILVIAGIFEAGCNSTHSTNLPQKNVDRIRPLRSSEPLLERPEYQNLEDLYSLSRPQFLMDKKKDPDAFWFRFNNEQYTASTFRKKIKLKDLQNKGDYRYSDLLRDLDKQNFDFPNGLRSYPQFENKTEPVYFDNEVLQRILKKNKREPINLK